MQPQETRPGPLFSYYVCAPRIRMIGAGAHTHACYRTAMKDTESVLGVLASGRIASIERGCSNIPCVLFRCRARNSQCLAVQR